MTNGVHKFARNTAIVCCITTGMSAVAWQEHTWRNGVGKTQEQFQTHKETQAATEATLAASVDQLTRQVGALTQILEDQQKDRQEAQSILIQKVYEALAKVRQAPCRVDTPKDTE